MKATVFCVETNKQANTDWVYIKETLRRFYPSYNVKYDRIYMGAKSKYRSKKVLDEISSWKKVYKDDLVVVYCIDTDRYELDATQKKEFDDISKFCDDKRYELVWFCHDIEEVYLGRSVNNNIKKDESIKFLKSKGIESISANRLCGDHMKAGFSNIMVALNRIMR